MSLFVKAVRSQRKLRAAIDGPSGSGKTYSMLRLAFAMKAAGLCNRIAVIDTENNSASLYAGESPDGEPWAFDALNLTQFSPDAFTHAIRAAVGEGYDLIGIDSLSHAWIGQGGALDLVDQKGGNKFTAWKDVTPLHRAMIDAIVQSPAHVLVTMRSKTEYMIEEDAKGKKGAAEDRRGPGAARGHRVRVRRVRFGRLVAPGADHEEPVQCDGWGERR